MTEQRRAGTVRFLHTSDWQLGMTRHFLEGEAQARYAAARLDAVRAIARVADEQDCEFVVVAGDVFDSNLLSSQTVRRSLDALRAFEVPVFLLPGNHDAYHAATVYRSDVFLRECPPNVRVIVDTSPIPVAPGVCLVGAPLTSNTPLGDPTAEVLAGLPADGTRRVLVAHGQVDAIDPDRDNVGAIRLRSLEGALLDGRIHVVALGDRHSRMSVGTSGLVHYSGSPEVTSHRDRAAGEVLVVDLPVSGPATVRPVRVGAWRFLDVAFDLTCADDVASLDDQLSGFADADRTVLRHALEGSLSVADHAHLEDVLARHRDRFAAFYPWDRRTDVAVYVDVAELSDLGVGGFVRSAVEELTGRAGAGAMAPLGVAPDDTGSPDPAQTASDALALLYRLAGGGVR